jgi:(R,R)-butanediol dehydrogenase/meso-butanediol dehydrogenase/diacetyl reductase
MRPGDRVLVMGAGPIGLGVTFWAHRFGARRVVVIARTDRRKQLALDMGASSFITLDEGYEDRAAAALGGPPDVIVECAGASGTVAKAIEMIKPRGSIVVIGLCLHAQTFAPAPALLKEVRIQFAIGTSKLQFEAAANMLAAGAVAPKAMVTQTIALNALPQEFEALRGGTAQCKVLVAP